MNTCPECDARVALREDVERGEVVPCPECGAELEVLTLDPVSFTLAPPVEEDWGE